nr:pentapeptide repeat-containing protein [Frankia sp. Cppng1_Ct_nod]
MAGLTYASLRGATLTGATLDETVLVGADLDSADLTKARLLTVGQLLSARLTETTRLDPRLADRPALIAHRVASRTRPAAGSNRSTTSRSS